MSVGAISLAASGDFDFEGDFDIMSYEMEDICGEAQPRFYIWEKRGR